MVDIFDEVEEDLRAERAKRALRRYGWLVVVLLVVVVGGVVGYQQWRGRQAQGSEQAALAFLTAARTTEAQGADLRAAADRFAAIGGQDAPEGYRILARLRAAALKAETGQRDAALGLYDAIAQDQSADPLYRDLANLMWSLHSLDSGDLDAVQARLDPLTRPDGAWRASAQELSALVALRRGDKDGAKKTLQALSADITAPQGVRDRAGRLLAGLEEG